MMHERCDQVYFEALFHFLGGCHEAEVESTQRLHDPIKARGHCLRLDVFVTNGYIKPEAVGEFDPAVIKMRNEAGC
ncbi:hypothetical protein A0H81_01009 [Grifola frondosa]|uniref:Uncharacterized protein n=1 Tax=Grifola frondosa TaxID=5627 RepID=A0A1C7MVH8_GRIFR|nr:hypothetical protein A0H81_01009 [Grifola frondosa]